MRLMNKNSIEYLELKKNILENYIQPFIDEINEAQLPMDEVVKETMGCFWRVVTNFRHLYMNDAFRGDIDEVVRKLILDNEFLLYNHSLCQAYIRLARLFIIEEDADLIKYTRTIIRELLFEILKPILFVSEQSDIIQNEQIIASWLLDAAEENQSQSPLIQLPAELQQYLNTFLQDDPRARINYRATCKAAYLCQKSNRDQPENIFYILGKPLLITKPRTLSEINCDICLRQNIPDAELLCATKLKKDDSAELFPLLTDAIEYAHSLRKGGRIFEGNKGYIPAIIQVTYIGNAATLQFNDKAITTQGNRRTTVISSASVYAQSVLPLSAICLYEYDFGSYHILNRLNLTLPPLFKKAAFAQNSYNKVHFSFSVMDLEAARLASHGFQIESERLKNFKDNLVRELIQFEKKLINSRREERDELIKQFKARCNDEFGEIIKSENPRPSNQSIAESLRLAINASIHFIAANFNCLAYNRLPFFAPNTGDKLKSAQQDLDSYTSLCLSEK